MGDFFLRMLGLEGGSGLNVQYSAYCVTAYRNRPRLWCCMAHGMGATEPWSDCETRRGWGPHAPPYIAKPPLISRPPETQCFPPNHLSPKYFGRPEETLKHIVYLYITYLLPQCVCVWVCVVVVAGGGRTRACTVCVCVVVPGVWEIDYRDDPFMVGS